MKVIVVMRNPKDLLVSLYQFYRMNEGLGLFPGTWSNFFDLVKEKRVVYGDYMDWCSSWWPARYHKNVLVLKYEDAVRDLVTTIKTLNKFCETSVDDVTVRKVAERTTFEAMKKNPMVNLENYDILHHEISPFIRKGVIGDWKNYFTPEQEQFIDDMYKEKCLSVGLSFDFE